MSNELPHATLRCAECSTAFRVTLKKGRPPSRPIPCPRCKTPITVTEADIVTPGKKKAVRKEAGAAELRQTKPRDILRETRHVKIDPKVIESTVDPPTSEIDPDPPTSEVDVEANPDQAEIDDSTPIPQSTPDSSGDDERLDEGGDEQDDGSGSKFGIIRKKRIAARPRESGIGLTVASPGVHVVKGEGAAARDDVFSPGRARVSSSPGSVAIGRIRPRQVGSNQLEVEAEDPDLPATAPPRDAAVEQDAGVASQEESKLNLDKLRRVMNKLDTPGSEPSEVSVTGDEELLDGLVEEFGHIEASDVEDLSFDGIDDVEEIEISLPGDDDDSDSDSDLETDYEEQVEVEEQIGEVGSESESESSQPPERTSRPAWVAFAIGGGFLVLAFVIVYSILTP